MNKLPWLILLFGVGGLIIVIPLALGGLEVIVELIIGFATRIVEGTPTWAMWQKIPIPVYLRIRIFNITNPIEIETGAKPIVQEVGPYVYLETLEKVDITVNDDDTVRYRQVRFYYFQPELSKGKEKDLVTFLNIAYVGVAKLAHDFTDADYILATLDDMIREKGEKLTRTHTVRELLFDGFPVKTFLDLASDPLVQSAGDINIPSQLLDGKMGILEGKNGTDDGWYVVHNGKRASEDFGRVVSWNGFKILTKWKDDTCNSVNGTDGMLYQPFLTEDLELQAYVPDLCRTLTFTLKEKVKHYGITCWRYRLADRVLRGLDTNPDNWCFCPYSNHSAPFCQTDGIISIAACFEGAPLYLSNPHFYGGDPKLLEEVQGLSPNKEDHFGYVDLHPMTGVSIEVRQRIQFNIMLNNWLAMPTFAEVSDAMVPILWAEEGGDIDSFTRNAIKLLDIGLKVWKFGKWFWIFFLLLVSAAGIGLLFQQKQQNNKVELIEDDDASNKESNDADDNYSAEYEKY